MKTPTYQKVNAIKPSYNCYNLICKVVEVTHELVTLNSGETLKIAKGVVGDETGVSNFRIAGKFADLLKLNKVICIRNGKSNVFEETIRLEIDNFGKVTEENTEIKEVNKQNNISIVKYEKRIMNNQR